MPTELCDLRERSIQAAFTLYLRESGTSVPKVCRLTGTFEAALLGWKWGRQPGRDGLACGRACSCAETPSSRRRSGCLQMSCCDYLSSMQLPIESV